MDASEAQAAETTAAATVESYDIAQIMRAIPHRYPFLMVDRVVEVHKNISAIGIKNVTINENFFQGHFPEHPVMPGVLIIECMAQTAAVLVVETLGPEARGKLVYFMTVENANSASRWCPGTRCASTSSRKSSAPISGNSVPKPRLMGRWWRKPPMQR